MKRYSGAICMDVDMEGDGKDGKDGKDDKDGKDGKDGEDKLGASLGRYKKCGATHHACGVCGAEWTGSHAWWYSNKACKWLCGKCQAKVTGGFRRVKDKDGANGWIDYKGKDGKDKNTDGGGGGAGDTEMCVS